MRVLVLSGYSHPSHHRKMELLANAADLEILHVLQPGNGKAAGCYPSENGQRDYTVQVVPIRSLGRPGDPHRTIHWPPRLGLARFRPDLIYCEHEQESLMALEVALARQFAGQRAPLVLYSWQNILRRRRPAARLVSWVTLRAAQHVVCASQEGVGVLLQQGYRGGTSVMPLFGLDRRYFQPRPDASLRERLGWSGFVAGYVGRLVPEKGVDVLLRAAVETKTPVQVAIVGAGPERQRLEALAQQLRIGPQCHFVGEVAQDEVAQYLNALDALVLPSRTTANWKEQFGRVLVEAMACQVAVVGSRSGAIPEVIDGAGCLFDEGDARGLAARLDELAGQPEARRSLAARGYARALGQYSVETIAGATLQLWRELGG